MTSCLPALAARCIGALLITAAVTGAQASIVTELESNDTLATAQNVGAHDGTLVIRGIADLKTDDHYRFFATEGDVIALRFVFSDETPAQGYDPYLILYDDAGAQVAINDTIELVGNIERFAVGASGYYTVLIRPLGSNVLFNYRLDVTGLTPTAASTVPVPGTLLLVLLGLAATRVVGRRISSRTEDAPSILSPRLNSNQNPQRPTRRRTA